MADLPAPMTVSSAHTPMTMRAAPGARAVRSRDIDLHLVLPCTASGSASRRTNTGLFAIHIMLVYTFIYTGQFTLIKCRLSLGHFVGVFDVSELADLDLRGILHHRHIMPCSYFDWA